MSQAQRITVGDTAPDFELFDNRKRLVHLADYRGRQVLLSWHPLAWTPVCAEQMKSLEAHVQEFEKANAIAFGLSIDPVPSKNHWAKELGIAQTMLLSDFWPHGAVAQSYGLFREADGYSERANILLDARGVVTWVKVYPVHDLPDIDEVLKNLASQ
ncbi:MAG: redoxin domain-containing protein [Caldisericota bacterium]|jgi:peroxiredoxin|nr:redoxin domain-containing protein [Caldisericota bacterium]